MATLASYVHVTDPDGVVVALAPGKPVPGWAVPLITNPKAWEGGKPPATPEAKVLAPSTPVPTVAVTVAPKVPPRGGAGSGRDAWAAYGKAYGVDITDDLRTREDVIAACELAGIPVE